MIFFLFSIGIVSILGQVVILRELNVAFFGVELIFIVAMGVWLFWSAVGALLGRRDFTPPAGAVEMLFVGFAILLPLEIVFIRSMRVIFGAVPGTYLPFAYQLLGVFAALLPPGVMLGLLFQWAAKRYAADGGTLASAYAVESAGGLVGGVASTLLLYIGVANFTTALVCSLAAAITAILSPENALRRATMLRWIAFVVLVTAVSLSRQIDLGLTRLNHPGLVESVDTPYGRITVEEQSGQFIVFENDALSFETEGSASEELVHLAAIQTSPPGDALVLGGALDGTLRELLKHRPKRIDYVEINPLLLPTAETVLPPGYTAPLASPLVSAFIEDPRRYLERGERYDLILVGMPDPASGQSNRFYTRDFFSQCARSLRPGGILSFRLRSPENLWTPFVAYRNSSVFNALEAVFDDAVVLPASANIVIASNAPLERDPGRLASRLEATNIATNLVTVQYVNYLYTNDRFLEIAGRIASTDIPANTDLRPVCYRFAGMIWLSKFLPALIHADVRGDAPLTGRIAAFAAAALCLAGIFIAVRRRPRTRRFVIVLAAGLAAMVMESVLILYYQATRGILFQNIGLLLTMFMAGLMAGAAAVRGLAIGVSTRGAGSAARHRMPSATGPALFGGVIVVNALFVGGLRAGFAFNAVSISLFLLASGFLVSGVFAWMSLDRIEDQRRVVSPLYAADLLGGCLGSLVAGLFLLPFLGIEFSSALVAALGALCLLLV